MESRPLKIGITCFPLIGGSGILATALGTELAARGHDRPFLQLRQTGPARSFGAANSLPSGRSRSEQLSFPVPITRCRSRSKWRRSGRQNELDVFHVHYAVPHATAAFLATEMIGDSAPKIVTTLHGTDTTLLGPNPQYRAAIEHALIHSDAVTTVSERLRQQTEETFRAPRTDPGHSEFFHAERRRTRSREEVRRELGIRIGRVPRRAHVQSPAGQAHRSSACG